MGAAGTRIAATRLIATAGFRRPLHTGELADAIVTRGARLRTDVCPPPSSEGVQSPDDGASFRSAGRRMSQRILRSPSSGSAEAATTPLRLARAFGGRARWRSLPDGQMELALIRDDGYLEQHLVLEHGNTSPLGSSSPGAAAQRRLGLRGHAVSLAAQRRRHAEVQRRRRS